MYANTTDKILLKYLCNRCEATNIIEFMDELNEKQNQIDLQIYPIISNDGKSHSPELWRDIAILTDNFFINLEKKEDENYATITPWGKCVSELYELPKSIEKLMVL